MHRRIFLLTACLVAGLTVEAQAGPLCHRCRGNCCKVCKLVPDVKKVTTYEFRMECEDYCIPGPSKCLGWKQVCECGKCPECVRVKQPTCARVLTRTKLVKIPVVKEECVWKCVVVCRCFGCNHSPAARNATPAETRLAINEATRQGILQVNYESPVVVTIPDEELSPPEGAAPQSVGVAEPAAVRPSFVRPLTAFGTLFDD